MSTPSTPATAVMPDVLPAPPPHAPLLAVRALLRAVAADPALPVLVVSPRPAQAAAVVRAWLADVAPGRAVVHERDAGAAAVTRDAAPVRVVRRGGVGVVRGAVARVDLPAVPPVGGHAGPAIFGA